MKKITAIVVLVALVLPGCGESTSRGDTAPDDAPPPDAPVEAADLREADDPRTDEAIDEVPADEAGCSVVCPDGFEPLCHAERQWCVSAYQGEKNCCDAWDRCASLDSNAVPGFWPDAGPHSAAFPSDFREHVGLPDVLIAFSIDFTETRKNVLTCFDASFSRVWGEWHDGTTSTCTSVCDLVTSHDPPGCEGKSLGCACPMPTWCVIPPY